MAKQLSKRDYDAVVIGSGPNGLAAAITIQKSGLSALLIEGKDVIGGGLRSSELTLPGFTHDVCSAIHPMAKASPFFNSLPLYEHGLKLINPDIAAVHPFDDGTAAVLRKSVEETARLLGRDKDSYEKLIRPLIASWPGIVEDVLAPLHFPKHPVDMASFGLNALLPASSLVKKFSEKETRGLWAGMAAHSIQPLSNAATSAIGLVMLITGHLGGWPIPVGGSKEIAKALTSYFISLGGHVQTNLYVRSLQQLPSSHVVMFDITPRQLLQIAGHKFSSIYRWQLERYQYGMGVFKIDWALDSPVPFTSSKAREAITLHLGNTFEEIEFSERLTSKGKQVERPFVLFAQPSILDATRAPEGKHTAWAYCHVPNGSPVDMTDAIEKQVERFAPGFKDIIIAKHSMNTSQIEDYNPNYIGGDINGGIINLKQLYTRPALRFSPYRTSEKGLYICSSSTPPGGGVHGMCGYHSAKRALKDIFQISI